MQHVVAHAAADHNLAMTSGLAAWVQFPVTAAAVTAIVGVLAVYFNSRAQADRIKADREIARRRLDTDTKLAERRLEADMKMAESKFALERDLDDWRRKVEFSELVLADFYQALAVTSAIRTPIVWPAEAAARAGRDDEREWERRRRDTYFPIVERIRQDGEFLDALHAKRFRAIALFGAGADEPFVALRRVLADISTAAQMLADGMPEDRDEASRVLLREFQNKIWEGHENPGSGTDAIRARLLDIVATVESRLRPILTKTASEGGYGSH